jgi:hypothetical protein
MSSMRVPKSHTRTPSGYHVLPMSVVLYAVRPAANRLVLLVGVSLILWHVVGLLVG